MTTYVMIIEDPHTDVEVRLYADRGRAIGDAVGYAADRVEGTGTEVTTIESEDDEVYLTWGEDYAVRVVGREVTA